jgi:hypothetical protein
METDEMSDNPKKKELIFGKYESLEEAEKGVQHLVKTLNDFKTRLGTLESENEKLRSAPPAPGPSPQPSAPAKTLVDDEGNLDPHALLAEIDNRLAKVNGAAENIPNLVAETVQKLVLDPVNRVQKEKQDFFSLPHVPKEFTEETIAQMTQDPAIKSAFDALASSPETVGQAYETMLGLWKKMQPEKDPAPGGDLPPQKLAATTPVSTGGPDLKHHDGENLSIEQLKQAALAAQDSMQPEHALAVAREFIKGSRLEKAVIDNPPEWAIPEEGFKGS